MCEGVLYAVSQERPIQVIERLKRQSVASMQDLERLMIVVDKKARDPTLIKCMKQAEDAGTPVRSIQELQAALSESAFTRLCKDAFK